jgi:hypothetical protein
MLAFSSDALTLDRVVCHYDALLYSFVGRQGLFGEALKSVRSIQTAEAEYHRRHNRYASLLDLGPRGAGLISARLA